MSQETMCILVHIGTYPRQYCKWVQFCIIYSLGGFCKHSQIVGPYVK